MKKVMTIVMAAALTLAAAGQASAAALETKGEYRGRYWFLSDYNYKGGDKVDDSQDFFDQRLRLVMGWQVSETVKLNARADILENVWDFTTGTNDKSEIDFDWAWADIGIGAASRLQVGKMDVSWGPGVYAKADNRYRVRVGSKFDKVLFGVAYDMVTENFDDKAKEDNTAWTVGGVMPIGQSTLGILGLYQTKNDVAGLDSTRYAIDAYWLGALGPAKITAEAAYLTGEDDKSTGQDIDKSGLMAYVGATMPVGPVGVGLEFGYAQGDDPGSKDENEGTLFHDYNGPFNSFILFNNFDLDGWNSVYSGGVDRGLNNAMALKASGTFAMNKQLSFMGAGVWAQADETKANQDSDLGVELDLLAKYALTENVTLQAGFGYLWAGDFYGEVDDPWVGTAHAIVTF